MLNRSFINEEETKRDEKKNIRMPHPNFIITFVADEKQKLRKNKRDKIRESGQRAQSRRIVITRSMGVTITSIKGIYRLELRDVVSFVRLVKVAKGKETGNCES